MRSYQSGTKDKKWGKKIGYAIALILALGALTTVIVLSFTLGKTPIVPPDEQLPPPGPGDEIPTDNDPVVTWELPVMVYELGQEASLDRVVYSASMNYWRTHNGIDFIAESGTAVMAISSGKVTAVQHTVLEATVITIDHGNGLFSYYKGLNENVSVEVGDEVETGDVIGTIAPVMPFEREVGAHLHLEMRQDGKLIDPAIYLADISEK